MAITVTAKYIQNNKSILHYSFFDNQDNFSATKLSVDGGFPPIVGEINFGSSANFQNGRSTVNISKQRRFRTLQINNFA